MAGAFIDFQMGFSIANLVDPQTGAQVPIIGNFKYILALLFLLSVDGHHLLIEGMMRSYQLVPLISLYFRSESGHGPIYNHDFYADVFNCFSDGYSYGGVAIFGYVALGIMARTVPQLNVFVVGIPLKIFVGFI